MRLSPGWAPPFLLLCFAAAGAAERVWIDKQGREIRGEFVREVDGEVTLLANGKLVTIPLDELSDRDRRLAQDLAAGKPAPDERVQPAPPSPEQPGASPSTAGDNPEKTPQALQKPIAIVNRVWTDVHGNQTTAKFVRMFGGNVVLSRATRTVTLPFYELSSEDQQYLKDLLTSQGKQAEIPPPPKPGEDAGQPSPATASAPAAPVAPGRQPPVIGGPSAGFEEMQKRAQQQREEMAQRMQELRDQQAQRNAEAAQRATERVERRLQEEEEAYRNEIVATCSACKKGLNREQSQLKTCPHCGVTWSYEIDRWGHKRQIASAIPNQGGSTAPNQGGSTAPNQGGNTTASAGAGAGDQGGTSGQDSTPTWLRDLDPDTRQGLIIATVVISVTALVAVVVVVAFAIANANTVSRQRRSW